MKIWHDDLGLQDDPHEMLIQLHCPGFLPVWGPVTGGDAAVAAEDLCTGWLLANFYDTVRSLMLAGF